MAANKTTDKQSKSAFVRSQSASMSAPEIIAAGKKAGLKISSSLVYMVRGRASKAKKSAQTTQIAKTTMPRPSTGPALSKAAFVRAHSGLSAKDVVLAAKAEDIKLGESYVYNVRGADKAKAKTKVARLAARRATPTHAPPATRPIASSVKAEELLRAVASEVGLGRAIELLEGERARVHSMMRG